MQLVVESLETKLGKKEIVKNISLLVDNQKFVGVV